MNRFTYLSVFVLCAAVPAFGQSRDYPVTPVLFTKVHIDDAFWSRRLEVNRTVSIPFAFEMCERTGRVDNFAIAASLKKGEQHGVFPFDDSDVYKVIEGASYSLAVHPDASLEHYLDSLIAIIAGAQEKDGYLYTARTNRSQRLMNATGPERWSNLAWSHELYDAGHLYEAATAFYEATGKRTLLDVAARNADLIGRTFGPDGLHRPSGHQEIEIGLAKLYRVTGDQKYIELAKFLLDQRGRATGGRTLYGEYAQDHLPVVEQTEAVGHAVRELYMLSGMADVAALTGDSSYAHAVERLWKNIVGCKMYVTGGIGAMGQWEGFGPAYDLPNLSAYCETCASIANALFNYRMFMLHWDGEYIDVLERTLYNALLSGVSMSGNRFFYPNPLGSRGQSQRSPWFECACCPSNVTRFVPSVAGYVYATRGDSLFVNLYIGNRADIEVAGRTIEVEQRTKYPRDGTVLVTLNPSHPGVLTVGLRIPGWAENEVTPGGLYHFLDPAQGRVQISVNGSPLDPVREKGYVLLTRSWRSGDVITLYLPMSVRRVVADSRVKADSDRIALQRGPIMYCAEGPDNTGGHVLNLFVPDGAPLEARYQPDILSGVETVSGKVSGTRYDERKKNIVESEDRLTAIPYYAWAHRGPAEMIVWLPRHPSGTEPINGPSIASTATPTSSGGTGLEYLSLPGDPETRLRSGGESYFRWIPQHDTVWVEYDFPDWRELSEVQVYWYEDASQCRPPKSWRVLSLEQGKWVPVYNPSKQWGTGTHEFNRVIFETVRSRSIRLEAVLQPGFTAGIAGWRVF